MSYTTIGDRPGGDGRHPLAPVATVRVAVESIASRAHHRTPERGGDEVLYDVRGLFYMGRAVYKQPLHALASPQGHRHQAG